MFYQTELYTSCSKKNLSGKISEQLHAKCYLTVYSEQFCVLCLHFHPGPRITTRALDGEITNLGHFVAQIFGQVRSAGSQVCPANLGDDLQQNLQEADDHKHHTVLHQIYQVHLDIKKHLCQVPKKTNPLKKQSLNSSISTTYVLL